ncbi:MAG: hypothetical protein JST54_32250 [Deltaproteobacteria bacterium]|nr:hypothetical protein [Deltaproteobacteria bacterium]
MSYRRGVSSVLAALVMVVATQAKADVDVYKTDDANLALGAMIQALGNGEKVSDPYRNDVRLYLFMKEARFRMSGGYQDYRFHLELGMGSEDTVVSQTGIALGLLDFNVDVPLHRGSHTYVRVGQQKVAYGREGLEYSGEVPFDDRSVEYLGFKVGRDLGAAVITQPGLFTGILGVYTGGGRDVPPNHYLPQNLGFPLVAARAGIGNVDGPDPLHLDADDLERPDRVRAGIFVNGLYTHDSIVGHSSVLNVKLTDKSLLLDSNWNPYIGGAPVKPGEWWQVGADAVVRAPIGWNYAMTGEVQGDWAGFTNPNGVVHLAGGRAIVGVSRGPFELAVRYAALFPDKQFRANGTSISDGDPIQEITPSLTWHIRGRNLQLTADAPQILHAPVFVEKGVGAYVGTELPDQSAVAGKNGGIVNYQNVAEARMMFQAQF